MQFTTSLVLALTMAHGLVATPIASTNLVELSHEDLASGGSIVYYGEDLAARSERTELYRESTSSGGELVYYGALPARSSALSNLQSLSARLCIFNCAPPTCPATSAPDCDAKHHGAANELCDKLLAELGDHSDIVVGQSPRQICYKNGKACCVSWSKKLSDKLTKGDLYNHADSVIKTCTANAISGKVRNVNIQGTCTDVCVSDRGTGC